MLWSASVEKSPKAVLNSVKLVMSLTSPTAAMASPSGFLMVSGTIPMNAAVLVPAPAMGADPEETCSI
jgi:hypothetical protein